MRGERVKVICATKSKKHRRNQIKKRQKPCVCVFVSVCVFVMRKRVRVSESEWERGERMKITCMTQSRESKRKDANNYGTPHKYYVW